MKFILYFLFGYFVARTVKGLELDAKINLFFRKWTNWSPALQKYILIATRVIGLIVFSTYFNIVHFLNLIGRLLIGKLRYLVASLILFYVALYWYLPHYYFDASADGILKFYERFDFSNPNDNLTLTLINTGNKVLGVLLPIALTFYFFSYREQKSTSTSSTNNGARNISFVSFLIITLLTIPYGNHLSNIISGDIALISDPKNMGLTISSSHSGRILLWGTMFIFSLWFGLQMARNLLRSINIRWLLNEVIDETKDKIVYLTFVMFSRKTIYDDLHAHIESIYQMLSVTVEKNMDKVYEDNFRKWNRVLAFLHQQPKKFHPENVVNFEYLLRKQPKRFVKLYRTILKNHAALIMVLYKHHKLEEAGQGIKLFFKLNLNSETLRAIYLTALNELALLLYEQGEDRLHPLLQGMENLAALDKEKNGIIMIYKTLIAKAVEDNEVQLLSSIAYSLSKCVKEQDIIHKIRVNPKIEMMLKTMGRDDIKNRFQKSCIFVLLQGALKSVEVSSYKSTGFLVKFLITNFDSHFLNLTFKMFVKHKADKNPYLDDREIFSAIDVDFHYNDQTKEYCLKKLGILIYSQQRYVAEKKVVFGFIPNSYISVSYIPCPYIDYLFEKLDKAKDKYGLMFLEDEYFIKSMKREVAEPSRAKQQLLYKQNLETASQLWAPAAENQPTKQGS